MGARPLDPDGRDLVLVDDQGDADPEARSSRAAASTWADSATLPLDEVVPSGSALASDLTDDGLGWLCQRSPAPGYPDEERTVIDCISVVMDEEIEHYRFAARDLAVLEAR